MDGSKHANNPNNFNEDGTIKRQGSKKVIWVKSNKYIKSVWQTGRHKGVPAPLVKQLCNIPLRYNQS